MSSRRILINLVLKLLPRRLQSRNKSLYLNHIHIFIIRISM